MRTAVQLTNYTIISTKLIMQVGSVSFTNSKVGEFWYRLSLSADAAPPVALPHMTCAVGNSVTQSVLLENPTGEEV